MLALLLLACSGGADSTDKSGNTGETTDSPGGDTAPACATVNSGDDWAWTGECPGMTTPVAITVDACAMTLDYDSVGGMTMGMPYSAKIDADSATFADDDSVKGCVGTVETADKITGSCNGGCTFKLKR